ncbi:MAG TPA: hypothetical protein VFG42_23985 [Baekduia sp.]|uniref:hypothetical protein n=1 Tax=Baekduia sp. TaxID=2600305 RepID=UPI002D77E9FF|nr:hypothetical protein [Baekduia sp.]HET6509874.1 hypothetical protein [Baekduia sp.]
MPPDRSTSPAARVGDVLKVDEPQARAQVERLVAKGLVQPTAGEPSRIAVGESGRALHSRVLAATTEITGRLWGDLPAEQLAVAGDVLATVLARANAELAS